MGCLPCFRAGSEEDVEVGGGSAGPAAPSRPNRMNLEPQELYQVDEFPIEMDEAQRWVVIRKHKPDAKYRMVCLPWAGGSSSIYVGWDVPNVEVVAIELPGRQARQKERPYDLVHPIGARLAEALDALGYLRSNEKKLIIMGHSFGSLIAYHTTVALRAAYNFTPWYLVLAGGITPRDRWSTELSKDDDDKIIATILDWGTVSAAVAASPEMKTVHVPVIRADHHCLDAYVYYDKEPKLDCPILAVVGTEDILYHGVAGSRWKHYTTKAFTMRNVKCHHYFVHSKKDETIAVIREVLFEGKMESDPIIAPKGTEHEPDSRPKPPTYRPGVLATRL